MGSFYTFQIFSFNLIAVFKENLWTFGYMVKIVGHVCLLKDWKINNG